MARPRMAKRKTYGERVTKRQLQAMNEQAYGPEPSGKLDNGQYAYALNWYSYMIDHAEGKKYLHDYLVSKKRKEEAKLLNTVPDCWINMTVAKIARMWSRNVKLPEPDKRQTYFETNLKAMLEQHAKPVTTKKVGEKVERVSIQDRVREKAHWIIGGIEELYDRSENGVRESVYDYLQASNVPAVYASHIVDKYQPWLDEMYRVYWMRHDAEHVVKDEQLLEGYELETDDDLVDRIVTLELIIRDATRYGENTKKMRGPRKKRARSVESQIKHVKPQKEDRTFKIASIDPSKVLGEEQLWTFHTRTKILTVFNAIDRGGLTFKRSSVANYDPKTSVSKRTGRKPEDVIKSVLDGGKVTLRRVMDGLKKPTKLQKRITGQTILLRVV